MPSIRRLSLMLWVMFIVLVSMSTHLYWRFQYQALLNEHQSQLDRFSSHIVATLDKYAHIPHLISKDKELVDALLSAQNSAQIDITNRYLEQVNEVIQAADTYLIDRFGNTIASSNWNLDRSFIGRNFAWRPYFYLSIAGQKSQYFALGSTSGQRGYYYAYPVIYAAEILGVIVVKMDLSAIEQGWQNKSSYFVATDDHQVVFMSSQPAWLFHSVADLSPAQLNDIRQSQQYLDSPIPSLGWQGDLQAEQSEWRKPEKHWLQDDYIVSSRPLPELALTIRVLSPKIELFWSAFGLVIILCMLFAIVYLGFQLRRMHRNEARLSSEVWVDALTGIANRRAFDHRLSEALQDAVHTQAPLSVLMIDVDHFKLYNDTYGHVNGDACLRLIAGAIAGCARRSDDIAARYGGEEFGMILPHTDVAGALRLADAIRTAVAELGLMHLTSPTSAHVTVSVGTATFEPGETPLTPDAIVRDADGALYRAKQGGRDRTSA
jgi:diguanylate cyclase (GGDEF)-like protein